MSLQKETCVQIADPGWVSLSQAVFDSFWKNELKTGADGIHLRYTSPFAPKTVEINAPSQTLRFTFSDGSSFEAPPWDFLRKSETLPYDAFAAALLHKAVGEIWDTMNHSFNRKVSSRVVSLFARMDDFRAPFASIPSDHWSIYRVTDWENGTAVAHDAGIAAKKVNIPGRKPLFDQDQINGEVRRAIKIKGFPERGGEVGWQSRADLERLIGGYCLRTTGKEPARSTLQTLAERALTADKSTADR